MPKRDFFLMSDNFIEDVLGKIFGNKSSDILKKSLLLQYLEKKTRSVGKSPKSRPNLANLYAIYVLVEDYIKNEYHKKGNYSSYSGANFSDLFTRQRELSFGSKLQNHALNNRCIDDYRKYFGAKTQVPIKRNLITQKYWINEKLLKIKVNSTTINIAESIIKIIDTYVKKRTEQYGGILAQCKKLILKPNKQEIVEFLDSLISPQSDARTFEIVSYVILKNYYDGKMIKINSNNKKLVLYKTGRTNANDGGIDFVMTPLGRFFQVTEDLNLKKFFLDIEKINRYPITFVIKSKKSPSQLRREIQKKAKPKYKPEILLKYMQSIEEIIQIPILQKRLMVALQQGKSKTLLKDLETYFKVEFDIR